MKYLLRQGLPFRGHDDKSGNFYQLLMLLAEDNGDRRVFLQRSTNFTSATSQNVMIKMYSYCILQKLASDINESGMFAIMVDGTKDITGKEQESICIRHVDAMLNVHEQFMGLYATASTTGEAITNIVSDVLIRFSLPINNLRAQTYDGAANMLGHFKGCQAIVKQRQPLALNFHCGSHVANLVMQDAEAKYSQIGKAINRVHDLGKLYNNSSKYKVKHCMQIIRSHNSPRHSITQC